MANTGLRLLFLLILVACTEKVSIEPVYTGDTDWKPTISLTANNYQRVGLSFEQPPRLELERNLVRYIFEVQRIGSPNFVPIDTINLIHRFRGFIPSSYVTPAILEQNTSYAIRMVVQYREGIEQRSYEKYFLTPFVRGKILERISWPKESYYGHFPPSAFGFGKDNLYMLHDRRLIRIDLSTGETIILINELIPNNDRFSSSYRDLPVHENMTILAEHPRSDPDQMKLTLFDLEAVQMIKSVKIPIPENAGFGGRAIFYDGSYAWILWYLEGKPEIAKVNLNTLEVIQTTLLDIGGLIDYSDFAFDGSDFWIASNLFFDNRISRLDSSGSIAFPQNRNPIYASKGLAWDGSYFWVYDTGTDTFAKLQLEGL